MRELGVARPSRSPATAPGFRRGRTPDNAGRKWPAEILTPAEVGLLFAGCSRSSSLGIRNRGILAVLYRAGLRVSECLALLPKDVDLEAGTIAVLHGKNDKRRIVGVDAQAQQLVGKWTERRAELGLDDRFTLFCSLHGTRLNPAYLRTLLPRLAREAGIAKRVHPHGLRHSMACELLREGIPMNIIQQQLGHSSIATTAIYLNRLAPEQVIQAMNAREWTP